MSDPTALLILDVISTFDFPRGAALLRAAQAMAPRLARLKRHVKSTGGRCIYANDNFADWTTDFPTLVSMAKRAKGRALLDTLAPEADDAHVLKPRHSAFHQTALKFLLDEARIQRVLVAGLSTESCVLATALEAHVMDLDVRVVSDCVASSSPTRRAHALSVLRFGGIATASAARAMRD
ncbi:MAG: cysteine hydrolase family protein [Luteimonas sp.]